MPIDPAPRSDPGGDADRTIQPFTADHTPQPQDTTGTLTDADVTPASGSADADRTIAPVAPDADRTIAPAAADHDRTIAPPLAAFDPDETVAPSSLDPDHTFGPPAAGGAGWGKLVAVVGGVHAYGCLGLSRPP